MNREIPNILIFHSKFAVYRDVVGWHYRPNVGRNFFFLSIPDQSQQFVPTIVFLNPEVETLNTQNLTSKFGFKFYKWMSFASECNAGFSCTKFFKSHSLSDVIKLLLNQK